MRSRVFIRILVFLIIMSLISPLLFAHADVLVEPDDDFYNRNRDKMKYKARNYYTNGESGYVVLAVEPNSARRVTTIRNGEVIHIMYTYDDNGEEWGVAELRIQERWQTGWVKMSQLYLVYDSFVFENENADKIVNSTFDISKLDFDGDMVMWTWPGSGKIGGTFETQWLAEDTDMNIGGSVYIDEEGREWGFLGYFYGNRNLWVCLDDPSNRNIPAFNPAPDPELYPAADPQSNNGANGTQSRLSTPMLAISLVSLVAMLSLVLISVLWDKKKGK